MFEKKIAGRVSKVVAPKDEFALGTKYIHEKDMWEVTRTFKDAGTDLRMVKKLHVSDSDAEEIIITLSVLRKEMKEASFSFVED